MGTIEARSEDQRTLKQQLRDVAAALALTAMWKGQEPGLVAGSMLDVLASLLRLEAAYVRVHPTPAGCTAIDAWWPRSPERVRGTVERLAGEPVHGPLLAVSSLPEPEGDGCLRVAVLDRKLLESTWRVVVCTRRPDFPVDSERFLLSVVAEQAVIAAENAVILRRQQVARDAAERAREQAEQARAEAEAAVRVRDEFLSIASHELRNPVAGLKASAQMLRRSLEQGRLDPERLDRFTRSMGTAADRLSVLLEDLLDVTRLQTGQLQLRPRRFDLARLVREVVARHVQQHPDRRIMLELGCDPCLVVADPDRIEQVVDNLLTNAIKYSPTGGDVWVSLARCDHEALLRVRDRGIGLSPEHRESIFEPFGRAPNAAAANIPGMGLGLYICRQIIQSHGGRTWAESQGHGSGATFHVALPMPEEAAVA